MFKIQFPNPSEMSILQFCSQMRVAIKVAERAYEEMVKEDAINKPYLVFRPSCNIETLLEDSRVKKTIRDEEVNAYDEWVEEQELYLEINIV